MKKILAILMCLLMAFTLEACTTPEQEVVDEGFKPSLDTNSEGKIVVVGSYSNFESLEAIFDDFNEYYPNIELSYVKIDDYNNQISVVLTGNDAPNIYTANSWMNGRDNYAEVFNHAENLADESLGFNVDIFRSWLLNYQEDGSLPMVPVFATTNGILINNNIFEKEGLEIPTTYSEFVAVCEAFKEKGYVSPIMGYIPSENKSSALFSFSNTLFYKTLSDSEDGVTKANNMDSSAGVYMKDALNIANELVEKGYLNIEECKKMEDNYNQVILRFFEGDVPMMIASGDTVSGTAKRESQSEAFSANPFTYSFIAAPVSEDGAYLLDDPNLQFAVNKECENLDMTNEFMRFLLSTEEMNKIAAIKRMITTTKDLSYDSVFAPLSNIPSENILSSDGLGIKDDVTGQYRAAVYRAIIEKSMTIDEVISQFGSLK